MKTHTIEVQYDNDTDELYLPISDEIMKEAGWNLGDTVEWIDNGNGSWSVVKKELEKEWVLVECVSMFRMRYMVEVPRGKKDWALDTVAIQQAKEFSQEHIDESIVSHRVVSENEAIEMCDIDNHYCKGWTTEQKKKAFFTHDGEKVEL